MREQQTATKLAQIDSMIGIFNSATPLDEYSALLESQLHSGGPPLHVKAKAIKDHKDAMARLDQPRWMRILNEFG